nr:zinc finger, CCHC-type [Tanacetum cinerariifolium]
MIEPNEKTQADNRKDKSAIAFLYQALQEDQLLQITKHKTAKAIGDALKTKHIREERVQQARLQTLKSDFKMLHMKEDEAIDIFTTKLTTLVNKTASLGHTMEDGTLVCKLLNVVPDRYLQIVALIEQYSDLSEMTLEEAIGRLKTYEERIKYKKGKQVDNQEKLMFTRHKNKGKYFRGRERHIAPDCPLKIKTNEQSNLVEEDLEPTSLMEISKNEEKEVSLHEKDVGYIETNMDSLWYLDNRASNHMTEVREHFKELYEEVSGKVRFGDGSYIEIKGKGSILIECDDEKQRIIAHVYYIPDLKSNLMSLGQFTEIGCKVVMENDELRLYYMDNKIFMKVTRQRNRLYKANLRIDQAFDTFKEYKNSIENDLRTTLKMLRTDRGGEFTSSEFTQYCKENGIARQLTAPYSPQQNGVVERRNRTIMSTTRCMMKATNMPQNFWAEVVKHAIYILNSVPTKALEDITPYEAIKQKNQT